MRRRRIKSKKAPTEAKRPIRRVPEGHNPHKPRGIVPWNPPKLFEGEIVIIIGGGPSLKKFDIEQTKGHRCVALNNAWQIAPWADVLHFADCQWWRWNKDKVLSNWPMDEKITTTSTSDTTHVNDPRLKRFWRNRNEYTRDRTKLFGWDSGTQGVHLARHLGASKIVLLGFDMSAAKDGSTQWHNEHKRPTRIQNYTKMFIPCLRKAIAALAKEGIPVVRSTKPGIDEAPFVPLADALKMD